MQYLALQTTDTHARMLLAVTDGAGIRVREAAEFSVDDASSLTARIRDTVNAWSCSGAKTLIAISRDQCELRSLTVPVVAPEEVPDLVRYQALQNFSALGPDWPLDYFDLPDVADGKRVLAGSIAPDRMRTLENLCEQIDCDLEGIVLRPCATAALVHQLHPAPSGEGQLVIDITNESGESSASASRSVDVFIMVGAHAVLMRSIHLSQSSSPAVESPAAVPVASAEHFSNLLQEIRRTIAAAVSADRELVVKRIVVCGSGATELALAEQLKTLGEFSITTLENWSGAQLHKSVVNDPPLQPARFLSLIGLITSELSVDDTVIDFRRPRRPPPPADHRRFWKFIAVLAATVLLFGFFGVRWLLGARDDQLALLRQESKTKEEQVEKADKLLADLWEIENWHRNSPNWLQEIGHLAGQLPPAEKLRLTEVSCNDRHAAASRLVETADRGRIHVKGYLDDASTITAMHDALRDSRHQVQSGERTQKPIDPDYPWYFSDTILVTTGIDEPVISAADESSTTEDSTESGTALGTSPEVSP